MYFIYFICPPFFHKTIYNLYYASTGVIYLLINNESMRFILWRVTIFSRSGRQLMSKTQALFNTKMQDVGAIPLETHVCWLLGSKPSQELAAFIQCLRYSPHYLRTNKEMSHKSGRGPSLWNNYQCINKCYVRLHAIHSTAWLNNVNSLNEESFTSHIFCRLI
jgi:hypothetical protein